MNKFIYFLSLLVVLISATSAIAQLKVQVKSGQIYMNDPWVRPDEKILKHLADSLNDNIKARPSDTTSLFYRAVIYLEVNQFIHNPNLSSSKPTENLLVALRMVNRADSLKMKSIYLKVMRAQIYKELTNRFAPIDIWRYDNNQMVERKKIFDHFRALANKYYDDLSIIDKTNAYDYQRLKIK